MFSPDPDLVTLGCRLFREMDLGVEEYMEIIKDQSPYTTPGPEVKEVFMSLDREALIAYMSKYWKDYKRNKSPERKKELKNAVDHGTNFKR